MKRKTLIKLLMISLLLTSCSNKENDEKESLEKTKIEESSELSDLSKDYFSYEEEKYEIKVFQPQINKFEEEKDQNIIKNIKDIAKDKYVIKFYYVFKDKSEDQSLRPIDMKISAIDEKNSTLRLAAITNIVDRKFDLEENDEAFMAIFISDKKIDKAKFVFETESIDNKEGFYEIDLELK